MDLRKLKKLIDLVEESGIAELEVTEGKKSPHHPRIRRAADGLRSTDDRSASAQRPSRRRGRSGRRGRRAGQQ